MTNDTGNTRTIPALLRSSEPTVIRQVTFTLRSFDHLKQFQRMWEAEQGISLNNNQALALIFDQHSQQFPMQATHHAR